MLGHVVEDDVTAREDVVCLRIVFDVVGPDAHIQIPHVNIAVSDIAVALLSLPIRFQANGASSYGQLDLSAKR